MAAKQTKRTEPVPGERETTQFRFTLRHIFVVTAGCAVCLGVGSSTGDFVLLPALVGVVVFLTLKTSGRTATGVILGFVIGNLFILPKTMSFAKSAGI